MSARITLLTMRPITPEAFYGLFRSALEVHGLAAVDSGDTIRVVPAGNAR